jgi:hypothetical protein
MYMGGPMLSPARHLRHPIRGTFALLLLSCSSFQTALAPAPPRVGDDSVPGQVPDSLLREAIRHGDLIVLATPVDMVSNHGFITPHFQLGAKETWYDVKLTVDSVLKGKLKSAKRPDYGGMPALFVPPPSFGKLEANEIVVQYPAVTSTQSDWAGAVSMVPGERAIFIFRRCYYCLPITGVAHGRGPYYKANPLVAVGRASKLPPTEWERVTRLSKRRPS